MKTRQVHLIERPSGLPHIGQFEIVEVELPLLKAGEVLVENLYMSVDPYMRRSMDAVAKDLEPWPIGGPLNGPSVGRVTESRNDKFKPGDLVESMSGWQEHFISEGDEFVPYISSDTAIAHRKAGEGIHPKDYLGLLGIAAQTGYFAISCAADVSPGDTLVVSSGAGTVGSLACQVGKAKGMRVVSSAGSDVKVAWLLDTLGLDHAFNYKTTSFADGLKAGCPNGIDLVLENASPEHMSACLPLMNEGKTILIAGFISIYSTGGVVGGISNFEFALDRYLTIKAFAFMEYLDAYKQFVEDMVSWRADGKIQLREAIHQGLEKAPEAFCNLFSGESFGKNLIQLSA
jgi:NADPH-dependent curcumin reductase CurA|tara:strand:- start:2185 stop:3219 length:1035 start_codon:yes stop_codon:yes gene_type:complete